MEPVVEMLDGQSAVGQGLWRGLVDRLLHLPKLFATSDGAEGSPASRFWISTRSRFFSMASLEAP
eukprot:677537-Pyramimonas_sp.AAC.1